MTLWTEEKTKPLIALQRRLLARAFELLAPGGRLVYSTCTTHVRENEEQVEWAVRELGAEADSLPEVQGFVSETSGAQGGLRIHGAEYGGQSFFLARLRKAGGSSLEAPMGSGGTGTRANARQSEAGKWLASLGLDSGSLPPGRLEREKGEVRFAPRRVEEVMPSETTWRGRYLGTEHKKGVRLTARLRSALPPPDQGWGLNVEDVATLRHLIAGQSFSVRDSGRGLPLYWRGLPLALLSVKNGRCLFAEKV
jgi:16S rRNA (cytosine1407-C5)-methyltransferase